MIKVSNYIDIKLPIILFAAVIAIFIFFYYDSFILHTFIISFFSAMAIKSWINLNPSSSDYFTDGEVVIYSLFFLFSILVFKSILISIIIIYILLITYNIFFFNKSTKNIKIEYIILPLIGCFFIFLLYYIFIDYFELKIDFKINSLFYGFNFEYHYINLIIFIFILIGFLLSEIFYFEIYSLNFNKIFLNLFIDGHPLISKLLISLFKSLISACLFILNGWVGAFIILFETIRSLNTTNIIFMLTGILFIIEIFLYIFNNIYIIFSLIFIYICYYIIHYIKKYYD